MRLIAISKSLSIQQACFKAFPNKTIGQSDFSLHLFSTLRIHSDKEKQDQDPGQEKQDSEIITVPQVEEILNGSPGGKNTNSDPTVENALVKKPVMEDNFPLLDSKSADSASVEPTHKEESGKLPETLSIPGQPMEASQTPMIPPKENKDHLQSR